MKRAILILALAAGVMPFVAAQSDKLDFAMLGRIRDEGLARSQSSRLISKPPCRLRVEGALNLTAIVRRIELRMLSVEQILSRE